MIELLLVIISAYCIYKNRITLALLSVTCFMYADWLIGTPVSNFVVPHNYSDVGLFLLILIYLKIRTRRISYIEINEVKFLKKGIKYMIIFYFSAIIVDIIINNVYIFSIIKYVRSWMLLSILWIIKYLRVNEIEKYIKAVFNMSIIISVVFIFEAITGISITGASRAYSDIGARASIPWPLSLFMFSQLLCNYYRMSKYKLIFCYGILFFNLIICGSRSVFIAYITVALLYTLFNNFSMKKFVFILLFSSSLLVVFSTDNMLSHRFKDVGKDVSSLSSNNNDVEGNFSFRILLLKERIDYLIKSPQTIIWGMGSIEEKNLKRDIFSIGYRMKDGSISQLDTGDISWSLLVIRLGLVGTILYIVFVLRRVILIFMQNRNNTLLAKLMLIYVLTNAFLLSFTYPFLAGSTFYFLPLLSLPIILQDKMRVNV